MTTPRKPLLAGNWKMHGTRAEAVALVEGLLGRLQARLAAGEREILVAPPFTVLESVARLAAGRGLLVAAQNCFNETKGAYTGEISPGMIAELGASHVILGHSERREIFGETDALVRRKVEAALAHGLSVILCVGETLAQRDAGLTLEVVEGQIGAGLSGLVLDQPVRLTLAYEPIWAIGTGRVATPEQAQETHAALRACLHRLGHPANQMRILYGGSVKPDNVDGLMAQADIDGALVGGASLEVEAFARIVEFEA